MRFHTVIKLNNFSSNSHAETICFPFFTYVIATRASQWMDLGTNPGQLYITLPHNQMKSHSPIGHYCVVMIVRKNSPLTRLYCAGCCARKPSPSIGLGVDPVVIRLHREEQLQLPQHSYRMLFLMFDVLWWQFVGKISFYTTPPAWEPADMGPAF